MRNTWEHEELYAVFREQRAPNFKKEVSGRKCGGGFYVSNDTYKIWK